MSIVLRIAVVYVFGWLLASWLTHRRWVRLGIQPYLGSLGRDALLLGMIWFAVLPTLLVEGIDRWLEARRQRRLS